MGFLQAMFGPEALRGLFATVLVDTFEPEELPMLVRQRADIVPILLERRPDILGHLRPFREHILQSMVKWDSNVLLDIMWEQRKEHYVALHQTPGGFEWLRWNTMNVKQQLPHLLR